MVVLDFLGQGQRAEPPQPVKMPPKPSNEFATHRAMILESGPSPRHERTFVARLDNIVANNRGGNVGPIRFSKKHCGGSNRNGAVFSPRNVATPPEIDAAMSALQSERLRAAIAEARSARAKPLPRYRQYEVLGRPLPKEARSTPQPIEPALNTTTSHIVGTVKQRGDNHLPALPRVKVADEDAVRKLRASAFAAFKRDGPSSETRTERAAMVENSARRRLKRVSDRPSSGTRSERKTAATEKGAAATERSARRRRKKMQAAEAAAGAASREDPSKKVPAEVAAAVAAGKAAQTTTQRTETMKQPHPPPDPRFPPRPAEKTPRNKPGNHGVPAGASSWQMGGKHPGVPKDPASPRRKPPAEPSSGSPRRSKQQMMSTVDRKTKLAHLEKQIGASSSALLQTLS